MKILFNNINYLSGNLSNTLAQDSSVYCLSSITETLNYYIGSASNTLNRISQHQDCLFGNRVKEAVHVRLLDKFSNNDLI